MKKGAIVLSALAVFSKIIGFVKEAVIAYYFGTSYIVDAFNLVDAICVLFAGWIVALATVYIPSYLAIEKDCGKAEAERFANSLIRMALIIAAFMCVVVALFSKQVIELFAATATIQMQEKMKSFLLISIWSTIGLVVYRITRAHMESHRKFIIGGVVDALISISMLLIVLFAGMINKNMLGYVSVFSYSLGAILCLVFIAKSGFNINLLARTHPAVKTTFLSALPILLNTIITDITSMTDKLFAVSLNEGTIAMLTYAAVLESAIYQIIGVPIITVIYPSLSENIVSHNKAAFRNTFSRTICIIFLVFAPIIVGTSVLSPNIIGIIYQRGSFSAEATAFTANLLRIYIWIALFVTIGGVASRFLIAIKCEKTVFAVGVFSAILNILLNWMLITRLGANGLAFASVFSSCIVIPIYFLKGKGWINSEVYKNVIPTIIKCVLAAIVLMIYVIVVRSALECLTLGLIIKNVLVLTASVLGGAPLYFAMLVVMRVEEIPIMMEMFRKNKHN